MRQVTTALTKGFSIYQAVLLLTKTLSIWSLYDVTSGVWANLCLTIIRNCSIGVTDILPFRSYLLPKKGAEPVTLKMMDCD